MALLQHERHDVLLRLIFACVLTLAGLSGCAPTGPKATDLPVIIPKDADLVDPVAIAVFPTQPDALATAFARNCTDNNSFFERPFDNEYRCIGLPTPEEAAGLILQYNGTVQEIPVYVSALVVGTPADSGSIRVKVLTYVLIPQRDGGFVYILPEGADLSGLRDMLANFLMAYGGTLDDAS